jgi:hypothetical protein
MLLLQAGLIKIKSGNMVEGRKLLNQSLAINPCTDPVLKHEIEKTAGKNDFTCCNTLIEHA